MPGRFHRLNGVCAVAHRHCLATGFVWSLFLGYAAALAFTKGAERALLGDFAPADQQGTVFDLYHLLTGIMARPRAVLFGVVWQWLGMSSAFAMAAVLTTIAAVALRVLVSGDSRQKQ